MSSSNPTVPATQAGSPANDIWRQHETQIRDLYQNKGKTLKEVKAEMEKQGFPKKPLSTWESKLRADLRIRKKNKATDWPLIYQHLIPRLERPGKKKLSKLTTIRLDGKVIPYDGAWKEIRRLGVHKRSPRQLPQGSLPHGIEVRTPSPVLSQCAITEHRTPSVASVTPISPKPTTALQLYATQTAVKTSPPHLTSAFSAFSAQIPNIHTPWMSLCHSLQNRFHGAIPDQLLCAWKSLEWWKIVPLGRNLGAQEIQEFQSRLEVLPVRSPRLPRPSHDLGYRLVLSRGNVSLSDFVSTSIYLLSNCLHDPRDGDKGLQLLCLLFEFDVQLFAHILQCELPTGRATWESLMTISQRLCHKRMFSSLLDIGIRCTWLNPSNVEVLTSALRMDIPTNTVLDIIDNLHRSGNNHRRQNILNAISMAYWKSRFDIAALLIQRSDINAVSPFKSSAFYYTMTEYREPSVFHYFVSLFESNSDSHWALLEFLLSNGADVDRHLHNNILFPLRYARRRKGWYNRNEINHALRLTVLDHSFRLKRSLFERLAQQSKVPQSAVTYNGLLTSLEEGADAFRDYLKTLEGAKDLSSWKTMRSPSKLLLEDEIQWSHSSIAFEKEGIPRGMNLKITRSLIQYAVDLNQDPDLLINTHSLLDHVLWTLSGQSTEDGLQILDILMKRGANITESHLTQAVGSNGTGVLEWLQPRVKNFSAKATGALAIAAQLNNFEAVEFLLQSGVSPDAFIDGPHIPSGIFIRNITPMSLDNASGVQATAADNLEQCSSLRMIQFLAERGAKLVVDSNNSTPFQFIALLLKYCREDAELFEKVKYALSTLKQSKHRARPPAYLLELCAYHDPFRRIKAFDDFKERMKIFEHLLNEGADVNPGSPLAALVRIGGPKELVERVLGLGANLNAFTAVRYQLRSGTTQTPLQAAASQGNEDLVYLFLKQGANVNSRARGSYGRTALQAICLWDPATEQEHRRKMTICELLLGSGADINAAPARRSGVTALQAAVTTGDLELAAILVRDGAHVNAPPATCSCDGHCLHGNYCALDAAARHGRLDVAKLLLDANALSECRGTTGYDGAISLAECAGHHALADLIRGYHRNDMELCLDTPDTREAAKDHHNHGYNAEDESTDDEYWLKPVTGPAPTDDDWWSTDEESSSSEDDAAEQGSTSGVDGLMRRDTDHPEGTHALPDSQVVTNAHLDAFMGYLGNEDGLAEDGVHMGWKNEPMLDFSMGSLAETRDSQAFPDFQVVANTCTDDRISHPGMGFVLHEEEMQSQWGNETMAQNPLEPWTGMPDDGALWQRVFEEQDREFGFATFDAGLEKSSSDHFGGPQIEGRDAELQKD